MRGNIGRNSNIVPVSRTSSYVLKEWEKRGIKGGTIRDIIFDFLLESDCPLPITYCREVGNYEVSNIAIKRLIDCSPQPHENITMRQKLSLVNRLKDIPADDRLIDFKKLESIIISMPSTLDDNDSENSTETSI